MATTTKPHWLPTYEGPELEGRRRPVTASERHRYPDSRRSALVPAQPLRHQASRGGDVRQRPCEGEPPPDREHRERHPVQARVVRVHHAATVAGLLDFNGPQRVIIAVMIGDGARRAPFFSLGKAIASKSLLTVLVRLLRWTHTGWT